MKYNDNLIILPNSLHILVKMKSELMNAWNMRPLIESCVYINDDDNFMIDVCSVGRPLVYENIDHVLELYIDYFYVTIFMLCNHIYFFYLCNI